MARDWITMVNAGVFGDEVRRELFPPIISIK
jgi:hypothetical protein